MALVLIFTATAAAVPPTISYSIDGIAGAHGWYRGSKNGDNVVLHWSVSANATSTNCLPAITIQGPTSGKTETCWAVNADGGTTAVTRVIKIDATPPVGLVAKTSRRPDYHGWYNHPVTIRWSGSDATSGIARCYPVTYHGPAAPGAAVTSGCIDRAGNIAASTLHVWYDATPPVVSKVTEQSTAAANVLSWSSSSPSDRIIVRRKVRGHRARTTVFDGVGSTVADSKIHSGKEYLYSVRSFDQAGNGSKAVSVDGAPKILTLRKTPYVLHSAPDPVLRWGPVRGAAYYNVQLLRGSKTIYSAWPTMHQIGLSASWRWSGRRYWLRPGVYRWYVWAGFGPRKLAHYRIVGSARFKVPRT